MTADLGRAYRVLVADDDANCRDSMASLLLTEGFEPLAVEGGEQVLLRIRAVEAAIRREEAARQREAIHFLVLDYNMPDLNGLEVLRRIREEFRWSLPAILVTGDYNPELEKSVLALGAFAVVPKPVQPTPFRKLLWRLIESQLGPFGEFGFRH